MQNKVHARYKPNNELLGLYLTYFLAAGSVDNSDQILAKPFALTSSKKQQATQ